MPVWNRANLVRCALDSIYAQGFTDYEIVLVDDGSTDELNEAIRPYLQRGLTFLRNERNMGVGVARNRGVRASHGSWIIFFDSDNRLLPDALAASHARAMEADSKVGVIWGRSRLHGVPNAPKDKIRLERMNYHDLLVLNSDIPEAVPIVRRTLIERFPFHENLGTRRECGSLVWHAIARAGFDYVWTREMVQEYFLQPDSLSAKDYLSRHPEEMVVHFQHWLADFGPDLLHASKGGYIRMLQKASFYCILASRYRQALQYAIHAIQCRPLNARSLALLPLCLVGPRGARWLYRNLNSAD